MIRIIMAGNPDPACNAMSSGRRFLAGLLVFFGLWFGFPNIFFQFPPAVFLWPLALTYLGATACSSIQAMRQCWLATFTGMAAALYWLYLPVYIVGNLHLVAAIGCALLICACLAVQGLIFGLGAWFFKDAGPFSFCFLLALLWYLLEHFLAILIGVPWLPLCAAFPAWPFLLQGASFVGGYFLGALWFLGFLLVLAPFFRKQKRQCACIITGLCILLTLVFGGSWILYSHTETDVQSQESMTALFVEGNIDQNQKWDAAFQEATLEHYIRLTWQGLDSLAEEEKKDLLTLWPETALPFFLETKQSLARQLYDFVRSTREPLLFGAPGLKPGMDIAESPVFNRAILLDPEGKLQGYYDKQHLVPFGEYLPKWLKLDFLESLLQGVGIYEEGQNAYPLRYGSLALGMLICYEGIFPWLAQERVSLGANLLVDISNDGWFGNSPAALQHLYLTIIRCVEQNRWLLRSTNTGLSAIVDNLGRIRLRGEYFKSGFLSGRANLLVKKSVYHALAPCMPWTVLVIFLCLAASTRVRKRLACHTLS